MLKKKQQENKENDIELEIGEEEEIGNEIDDEEDPLI
jgi:hypothetical protein